MSKTAIKTRPIIFFDNEVRRVLDGTINKIWRLIEPQPQILGQCREGYMVDDSAFANEEDFRSGYSYVRKCPYGKAKFVGDNDRLWVQEAYHIHHDKSITYMANMDLESDNFGLFWKLCNDGLSREYLVTEFQQPQDMLHEQSRITLEITSIGVERQSEREGWIIGFKIIKESE